MHRNIFGVALSKVAAILIATTPFVNEDALEHLQEERAQWRQTPKNENKPLLGPSPDDEVRESIWFLRLAREVEADQSEKISHVILLWSSTSLR